MTEMFGTIEEIYFSLTTHLNMMQSPSLTTNLPPKFIHVAAAFSVLTAESHSPLLFPPIALAVHSRIARSAIASCDSS
jgi:hypothetical protein